MLIGNDANRESGPGWKKLIPPPFTSEQELQNLLAQSPGLLAPESDDDAFAPAKVVV